MKILDIAKIQDLGFTVDVTNLPKNEVGLEFTYQGTLIRQRLKYKKPCVVFFNKVDKVFFTVQLDKQDINSDTEAVLNILL